MVDDQRVSLSSALLRSAHGDAWQAEGRLRAPFGGGAAEIRGARMMASGLPVPKWNNADIVSADVSVDALQAWYAERDVPWGIRVPLELNFHLGEPLFEKRCAGLLRDVLRPAAAVTGVSIHRASPADLPAYAAVELAGFGSEDPELERRWLEPAMGAPGFDHWIAEAADEAVGVAMTLRTAGRAGPAAYLGGVAAVPGWQGKSLEAMLASRAATEALNAGAAFVHFNPDEDELGWASEIGFVTVPGFLVRVVRPE